MLHTFSTPFTVESFGNFLDRNFSRDFDYKGEQHDFIELVYVISGKVEVVEDEKVYQLGEGDLMIHAPMEFHRIRSYADTSPHVLNISFFVKGELPGRLYDGVFHISTSLQTALVRLHRLGAGYCERENGGKHADTDSDAFLGQQIACTLSAMLLEISRESPLSKEQSNDRSAKLYRRLVRSMEESICGNLALEELADRHFISVSYVKKLFRIYADMGPGTYYNHMRAREAAMRLEKGSSAAEVAEQMNFSSPNYFTLFFKKQTGMTPSEYKKHKI